VVPADFQLAAPPWHPADHADDNWMKDTAVADNAADQNGLSGQRRGEHG
jgi:hypothetical protein